MEKSSDNGEYNLGGICEIFNWLAIYAPGCPRVLGSKKFFEIYPEGMPGHVDRYRIGITSETTICHLANL